MALISDDSMFNATMNATMPKFESLEVNTNTKLNKYIIAILNLHISH